MAAASSGRPLQSVVKSFLLPAQHARHRTGVSCHSIIGATVYTPIRSHLAFLEVKGEKEMLVLHFLFVTVWV